MAKFRNRPIPQPFIKEKPMSDTAAQDPTQPVTEPVDQSTQVEVTQPTTEAAQEPVTQPAQTEMDQAVETGESAENSDAPVTQTAQPGRGLTTPVVTVDEVVKAEVKAPAVKPAPVAAPVEAEQDPSLSEEEAYLAKIALSGTPAQKRIFEAAKLFVERTQPRKPMKRGEGMQAQSEFLDHLFWLLDSDPSEFQKGWATLLVFFKAHHGDTNSPRAYSALSEYRSCDFREDWQDVERMQAYTNLVTLLRTTRHKPTRSHDVKRVKLDTISPQFVTDHRLENLQRFYSV